MEAPLSPRTPKHVENLHRRYVDKADPASDGDPWGQDYRTRAQHDRDRIIYSAAFQRLAYVTQVTAPESGHIFHNRMSHSLKVAQVGRRNAERLIAIASDGGLDGAAAALVETLDPDAVEASCLENDGLRWPRRDGLKWLHPASVVVCD